MTEQHALHVTVAAIIERNQRFLMVFEQSEDKIVINQPAGHVEHNESIMAALKRETLEETCWKVKPLFALGISQYRSPLGSIYLRHSFIAEALELDETAVLDKDIIRCEWLTYEEITADKQRLRSPLVLNDIERYRAGIRFPLELYAGFI